MRSYGRDGGRNDKIWGENVRKVGKICQNEKMARKKEIPMETTYYSRTCLN
jgi:hypothetical protein